MFALDQTYYISSFILYIGKWLREQKKINSFQRDIIRVLNVVCDYGLVTQGVTISGDRLRVVALITSLLECMLVDPSCMRQSYDRRK